MLLSYLTSVVDSEPKTGVALDSEKRKIHPGPEGEVIFTDLFDTLVHRSVHPKYALKLWSKFLIRELGLSLDSQLLFNIREEALSYLSQKQQLRKVEISYKSLIREVFDRLVNSDLLTTITYDRFSAIFQEADYRAETAVQFKNENRVAELRYFWEKGYRIYLITDFHLSESLILKILDFHGIAHLFNAVFVSCSLGKSKERGTIYDYVLKQTTTDPKKAVMMGDNKISDVVNAEKSGIKAVHLKHLSHKLRNKVNLFGDDSHQFDKVCQRMERLCQKSPHPFSEYILHFYFFTERLYIKAKKKGVKNLFFLAREGYYMKRLFEAYQEMNGVPERDRIATYYLRISRHSALQTTLRSLEEEDFSSFKKSAGSLSPRQFLSGLCFPEAVQKQLMDQLGEASTVAIPNFFRSEAMAELRKSSLFAKHYEIHRKEQKTAFNAYLESFMVDFEKEGLHLVDVGWGGTMQENLYRFFGEKIPVTGYYLGLKEVYNIQKDTKRYGLNFSIYPNRGASDEVLKANGQLYEQLLAAPHGSTIGYTTDDPNSFALSFHEANEKYVFENLVRPVQEYMYLQFRNLFQALRPIAYSQEDVQDYLTDLALRTGILGKKENSEFVDRLSKGFYQNVGQHEVGVTYSPEQIRGSKLSLFLEFLKTPEKSFRYLVKVKPFLYAKGKYWLSWPLNLAYYYIKFNFWFRKKWLGKGLV